RPAAALDQAEFRVDLVGAIDIEVEFRFLVKGYQRDLQLPRKFVGALGCRHPDHIEASADAFGEQAQEMLGRAPGAEPELHPRRALGHRRRRRPLPKPVVAGDLVVAHRSSPPISMYLTSTNSSTP